MKVLVFGGSGMLGHKVLQVLEQQGHQVWAVVRPSRVRSMVAAGFAEEQFAAVQGLPGTDDLIGLLERYDPEAVVNCIGIVKQSADAKDAFKSFEVNGVFPHRVAALCSSTGKRLVHISTDCVFSGQKGNYLVSDVPDPVDVYGQSKLLGEVDYPPHLTIRTSIIGRELFGAHGLVEWFLGAGDTVSGYTRARFSGLTTLQLARDIETVLTDFPELCGVMQVAAQPIDKFALLGLVDEAYGLGKSIEPDDRLCIDRSLDGSLFNEVTGLIPPAWPVMVEQMAADSEEFGYAAVRQRV